MKTSFLFAILLTGFRLAAQTPVPLAMPGPSGIFVHITKALHGPRYTVERQEAATRTWAVVHTTEPAPQSVGDLKARLLSLSAQNPTYTLPDDSTLARIYGRFGRFASADSLYAYGTHPLLLQALGLGWYDGDLHPGPRYEYRFTALTETAERPKVTTPVAIPGPRQAFGARWLRGEGTGQELRLRARVLRPSARLGGVKVLRGVFAQTNFEEIPVDWAFRAGQRDSVFIEIRDATAQRRVVYQYVVIPTDAMGNEGLPSDTLTLGNVRAFDDLPTVLSAKARSDEDRDAVRLSWRLSSGRGLREISIRRSTDWDGPYQTIGSALPGDTAYFDQQVTPVQTYYYQLILNGTFDEAPASVRFPGMLNASRAAVLAPRRLTLTTTQDALELSWLRNEADTRGYYLYRGEGFSGKMERVSDVILSRDSLVNFSVKRSELPPANGYAFAVAAVNTSYHVGPLSEKVFTGPIAPAKLLTPLGLAVVRAEKGAQVIWKDMRSADGHTLAYAVFRKAEGDKEFKEIFRQKSEDAALNTFTDPTVERGKRYQYRIQALGLAGARSGFSAEAAYFRPLPGLVGPGGLKLYANNDGVLLRWDAPEAPTLASFNVYRVEANQKPRLLINLDRLMTRFVDRTAQRGTAYGYYVTGVSKTNEESPTPDPVPVSW